jgi:hypothetical protein
MAGYGVMAMNLQNRGSGEKTNRIAARKSVPNLLEVPESGMITIVQRHLLRYARGLKVT